MDEQKIWRKIKRNRSKENDASRKGTSISTQVTQTLW